MKKLKNIILLLSLLLCCILFSACSGSDSAKLIGEWRTENLGYYTVTTFREDGSFRSVYTVSDPDMVAIYGISQEMLDSMEHTSYYTPLDEKNMSEEQKQEAKGRSALFIYASREDMEQANTGSVSYYSLDGDVLTMDGCVYTKLDK